MKKLFALLLAFVMMFSLATVAFADNDTNVTAEPELGSVTINSIGDTTIYKIYRILDGELLTQDEMMAELGISQEELDDIDVEIDE